MELTLPSRADVLSLSFWASCRKKVISVLNSFISVVRVAMHRLQVFTAVKLSRSVCSPAMSETVGSGGLAQRGVPFWTMRSADLAADLAAFYLFVDALERVCWPGKDSTVPCSADLPIAVVL